jgi:hypothetical protein
MLSPSNESDLLVVAGDLWVTERKNHTHITIVGKMINALWYKVHFALFTSSLG